MALFDALKEAASAAKEGGQTLGRLGQLKVEMTKAQAKIGELYAELGIKAYRLHEKRELSHPDLDGFFQQIDDLRKEYDRAKSEYDGLSLKHDAQNQFAARSRLAGIAEEKSAVDREAK